MPTTLLLAPPPLQIFRPSYGSFKNASIWESGFLMVLLSSCSSYARKTFEFSSFDIMVQTCKPNVKRVYINLRHYIFD